MGSIYVVEISSIGRNHRHGGGGLRIPERSEYTLGEGRCFQMHTRWKCCGGEHPQPETFTTNFICSWSGVPLCNTHTLWWMDFFFIRVNGKWDLFWLRLSSSYLLHESEKDFKWPWRNYWVLQLSGIFTRGIRVEGLFRLFGDYILRAAADLKYKYVFHACLSYCLFVTVSDRKSVV